MGTVVDGTSVTRASWRSRHSALRLAVAASRTCLFEAGVPASDLDLLVNTGLYRDHNLGEPALAALIQEDIGANPEDPHPDAHGTFSFDVANGVCGPLTALQVADGFLRSGTIRRALLVTSDADPGRGQSVDFPFAPVGAAMLCSWSDDDSGLGPVSWGRFPDSGDCFHAKVSYQGGRNVLRVVTSEALDLTYAEAAASVASRCLERAATDPRSVDRIIAAPAHAGFVAALAEKLAVDPQRICVASEARTHTAAHVAAFHGAHLEPGDTALLVAVGAGVTAGACLYQAPGRV